MKTSSDSGEGRKVCLANSWLQNLFYSLLKIQPLAHHLIHPTRFLCMPQLHRSTFTRNRANLDHQVRVVRWHFKKTTTPNSQAQTPHFGTIFSYIPTFMLIGQVYGISKTVVSFMQRILHKVASN